MDQNGTLNNDDFNSSLKKEVFLGINVISS